MNEITPCLWFDFNAEEAVNHYLGIFKQGLWCNYGGVKV